MSSTIISINLNDFKNGSPSEKQTFVQDLGTAFEKIGFVAIFNHELSNELSTNLYNYTKA